MIQYKLFSNEEIEKLQAGMEISMSEEDLLQLRKSVKEYGFITPIIVKDGVVVDGNHRLKVAKELGISEVPVIQIEKDIDPNILSITLNLARRHLTPIQKIIFIEKLLELSKEEKVKERLPKTHEGIAGGIAKIVNVSPTTVKKVKEIKANPEILEKVKAEEISLEQAYQQVKQQKEQQKETFKYLFETEKAQKEALEPDQEVLQKLRLLYTNIRDVIFSQKNTISITETAKLIRLAIQILVIAVDVVFYLPHDDRERIISDLKELIGRYERVEETQKEVEVC
ncbi:MAG: ParB N-terminal domain-containing protein [Thermodesulfovibrio sp.]